MKRSCRNNGFTLIETMIAVLIFSVLLSIAAPALVRARAQSQAKSCSQTLRNVNGGKEQFVLDTRKNAGAPVSLADVRPYMKTNPVCPSGGAIDPRPVNTDASCTGTNAYKHTINGL